MVPEVFVKLVDSYKDELPVTDILSLFDIPKSTYYRWKGRVSNHTTSINEREKVVVDKCNNTKRLYGYRKITGLLNKEGYKINKNTVQRVMQKYGLQCRVKVKRAIPYKGKESIVAENILDRDFKATRPLEKLVTDITYLPWSTKNIYLSSIMDLYSGEIIAYTIGDKQDLELVDDTLKQLPNITESCTLHSDQGSVYTAQRYQKLVKEKSITMSMSRKGTPSDNAPIESFHSTLKSETFYLNPELKSSTEIITQTVLQYIHYYNNTRVQTKLDYMSPVEYRLTHNPE